VLTLAQRLEASAERPWPARPIPVSLVITDLDVGGAERSLVALATGLDRSRWSPSVIALGPEAALAIPLREASIQTVCLDVSRRRPFKAVRLLRSALRKQAPELVQSFLFHANLATRLALLGRSKPWSLGGLRVAEHEKRWHLHLERISARWGLGSVCVSRGVRDHATNVGGMDPAHLVVIPNGIDLQAADRGDLVSTRAELGLPPEAHLALFVGRLEPQKGIPFLLDAAEEVVGARPDWHLVMVGDGPDREQLQQRTRASSRLRDRVHWLGRRGNVRSILNVVDLLVLPSLWEGMPNVVLEAMAARRAVVATEVEGSADLVVPGQTGWLVPPGQSIPLREALLEAASQADRLVTMGAAGRARVEAAFSMQAMISSYERLWARVLGLKLFQG